MYKIKAIFKIKQLRNVSATIKAMNNELLRYNFLQNELKYETSP